MDPVDVCPLCSWEHPKPVRSRKRHLWECGRCRLVYSSRAELWDDTRLRERYLQHRNGPEHPGYCAFLTRVLDAAQPYVAARAKGLDFGCGPAPTLSQLAVRYGWHLADYDSLFHDTPLEPPYEVIFSTECFEHFDRPDREIRRVVSLLANGGVLAVMTELWNSRTDWDRWHYASDPAHVAFYAQETLEYVCKRFGLIRLAGDGERVFVFQREGLSHGA